MFDGDKNTAFVFPRGAGAAGRWQVDLVLEGDHPLQGVFLHPVDHPFQVQVELPVSADGRHYERLRRIHFHRRRTLWNLDPMTWASLTLAMPRRLRPALRLRSAEKGNPLLLRSNGGGLLLRQW
jgi:hypothetical protein